MVVVGGGFLGSELACALGHRGALPHFCLVVVCQMSNCSLKNNEIKLNILNFDCILSGMLKIMYQGLGLL